MKSLITALLFLSCTNQLMAVELSAATNQQLLDEVYRRMNGSPTGAHGIANYICDSNSLKISLIGTTSSGEAQIYIGNPTRCTEQVVVLNAYKSKIYGLNVIAVCDSNSLKRYSLQPTGALKELDSTYIGDYAKCLPQAKSINEN